MQTLRLGPVLRCTLLLTLALPILACGGATKTDPPQPTATDSGANGGFEPGTSDAGVVDPDVDAAVIDSVDAGSFDDAPTGCVLTKTGVGGAGCKPTVLTCDHEIGAAGTTLSQAECQALCPSGQPHDVCKVEQATNVVDCWLGCGG